MKVVILAGGLGTRLGEDTHLRPKPMVEIGGKPILWHIMKIYSHYGYHDFVILCGYKSESIKEYFINYYLNNCDITIDLATNQVTEHRNSNEPWRITTIYTGLETMTGGRIRKIKDFIGDEPFMLTYGDGVADINIEQLVKSHQESGKLATLTAVQPSGRFGAIEMNEDMVIERFEEKPHGDGAWINGGFFVLEPQIFDYIDDRDDVIWEQEPLKGLVESKELHAFKHEGFWRPMDTLRDKNDLMKLWEEGHAPWKVWKES